MIGFQRGDRFSLLLRNFIRVLWIFCLSQQQQRTTTTTTTTMATEATATATATAAASVSRFELDPDKDVSYINLTILDASKTVAAGVKDKLRESNHKMRYFPVVKRIMAKEKVQDKIASKVGKKVTPTMIAKGLSNKMPNLLAYMMHQKAGMKVAAQTVFVEDAYVVIEFQVKHIDSHTLLAKAREGPPDLDADEDLDVPSELIEQWIKGQEEEEEEEGEQQLPPDDSTTTTTTIASSDAEEQSSWKIKIVNLLEYIITRLLPDRHLQRLEHETLPAVVQTKITEQMGAILEYKLGRKQLEAEIAVLSGATQARYFYSNLKTVRERNNKKSK
jgi:hypothetical protein